MSITCQICLKEFEKQITNSHLKTHNTDTLEYKRLYGDNSLTCSLYKQFLTDSRSGENNPNFNKKWDNSKKEQMSAFKKGSEPWNKGQTYSPTERMINAIAHREEKYKTGELIRTTHIPSLDTRKKISESITQYASTHKDEIVDRAKKAIQTKNKNGYDFGKNMRGKKHTDDTKQKLIEIVFPKIISIP
jgi:hypothetical protein